MYYDDSQKGIIERKAHGPWLIKNVDFVGLTIDDLLTMIEAVEKKKELEKYDN